MKSYSKLAFASLSIIIVFSFTGCHSSDDGKNSSAQKETANLPTVLVSDCQTQSFQSNFSITGTAMPNQEVKVFAMCNGYVESWKYDIGDMVKHGEVLAMLANPELMEKQAKAKAELEGDKSIYDRLNGVYKKTPELTPLEKVDEAKAKFESAQAELSSIESRISYLTVRAPFDGVITERYIDDGTVVQDGLNSPNSAALFKIQDNSIIRVNVNIPEVNTSYITKGTVVNIIFPDIPNTVFDGKVSRISYGLNEETKTMLAQIDLSNTDSKIHPGMFANVIFRISSTDSVQSVPNAGILNNEQQTFVYKVTPIDSSNTSLDWTNGVKCMVKRVNVQIGIKTADFSELKYADLKKGDRIIISGNSKCSDGSLVIAKENKGSGK